MRSSSGPTSSLAAAVDGLLADTVLGALGPTPSPKRKAPEPAEAGGAEDSAAEAPVRQRRRQASVGQALTGRWDCSPVCPTSVLSVSQSPAPPNCPLHLAAMRG